MKKTMLVICVDKRDGLDNYSSNGGSTEEYDVYFVSSLSQLQKFAGQKCEIVVTQRYAKNGISQEMRTLITSISDAPLVDRFVFISMLPIDWISKCQCSCHSIVRPVLQYNFSLDSDVPGEGEDWPAKKTQRVAGWLMLINGAIVPILVSKMSYDRRCVFLGGDITVASGNAA